MFVGIGQNGSKKRENVTIRSQGSYKSKERHIFALLVF